MLLPPARDPRRARDHERAPELLRPGRGQGAPAAHLRLHGRQRPPGPAAHIERAQPRFVRALLEIRLHPPARVPGHVGAGAPGRSRRVRAGARSRASRDAGRRARDGGARARGLRRVARPRLRPRHRERAGLLGRGCGGGRLRRDRRLRDLLRSRRHEHHRPARRPHRRRRDRPRVPRARSLSGSHAARARALRAASDRRADVRVGRTDLRAALLPGARRVPSRSAASACPRSCSRPPERTTRGRAPPRPRAPARPRRCSAPPGSTAPGRRARPRRSRGRSCAARRSRRCGAARRRCP